MFKLVYNSLVLIFTLFHHPLVSSAFFYSYSPSLVFCPLLVSSFPLSAVSPLISPVQLPGRHMPSVCTASGDASCAGAPQSGHNSPVPLKRPAGQVGFVWLGSAWHTGGTKTKV